MRAVWNFELFAVEDTAVIDGQTVATSRGVTIGKSIGALLLFVLGYGLVAAIARAVAGRLIAKGHDPARVRSVVEEMASTYEEPEEVINWYYGNREQLASVEAVVLEDQVIDTILERATVTEVPSSYEEALRADPPKLAGQPQS